MSLAPCDRVATDAATDVVIRAAAAADLDRIAAIEQGAFADPWSRDSFASLLSNPATLFAVAAPRRTSTHVLGYVVCWFAADESEIANIAVCPSARRLGVGARLLHAALDEAARRGAATTYLEVRESNHDARRLYAAHGFVVLGRRRGYYRHPVEDALVLSRPIVATPSSAEQGAAG